METATATKLLQIIVGLGGVVERQKGSHAFVRCGECTTVIPMHKGSDIATGTLRSIERDLAPCLGKDWLRKA